VRIARASARWRWGEGWLAQTVAAEPYCGKRLRFSGAVRANVCEVGAGAQLYIETRPKPPASSIWTLPADNLAVIDRPIRSIHWRTYAVEVDVPTNAYSIVIGCALAGNGTAWFGDLALDVCQSRS
jgi:hypothetical protein